MEENNIVEAINTHSKALQSVAEAIKELAHCIAQDEPLNYTIGRGMNGISENVESGLRAISAVKDWG